VRATVTIAVMLLRSALVKGSLMDVVAHNRNAWNEEVANGSEWTIPVTPEVIEKARRGDWELLLTESRPVPRSWFPELAGRKVLSLAGSGGQQAPILAAAGAIVTVLDNSERQLAQDQFVAQRDGLAIETLLGDMQDLSAIADGSFDLVFHPVSNIFVPDVKRVWCEVYRVLRPGGVLMTGCMNPIEFALDYELAENSGLLQVRYEMPYSDVTSITEQERVRLFGANAPMVFGHTLEDLIGGQLDAGFVLTSFFEARRRKGPVSKYLPSYFATRSVRPI
jgi:SAM-dependent methyltransferase